jgi:putative addiction module component (TIGR02574 family)
LRLTVEALSLPADERAAMVLRLAESLDEEHDADAEEAWVAEVAARIEAVRLGRAETITTGRRWLKLAPDYRLVVTEILLAVSVEMAEAAT